MWLRLIVITLPYDNYNTPQAQCTVGYEDRLKRKTDNGLELDVLLSKNTWRWIK